MGYPPSLGNRSGGNPISPARDAGVDAPGLEPPFGSEHEALRAEIRSFVAGELAPHADEWERERWFPNEVFGRMGDAGLLGLKYPVEYGGRGGDYLGDAILIEELGRCNSGG